MEKVLFKNPIYINLVGMNELLLSCDTFLLGEVSHLIDVCVCACVRKCVRACACALGLWRILTVSRVYRHVWAAHVKLDHSA